MVVRGLDGYEVYNVDWKYEIGIRYFEFTDGSWNRYISYGDLDVYFRGEEWSFRRYDAYDYAWWYINPPEYGMAKYGDIKLC